MKPRIVRGKVTPLKKKKNKYLLALFEEYKPDAPFLYVALPLDSTTVGLIRNHCEVFSKNQFDHIASMTFFFEGAYVTHVPRSRGLGTLLQDMANVDEVSGWGYAHHTLNLDQLANHKAMYIEVCNIEFRFIVEDEDYNHLFSMWIPYSALEVR